MKVLTNLTSDQPLRMPDRSTLQPGKSVLIEDFEAATDRIQGWWLAGVVSLAPATPPGPVEPPPLGQDVLAAIEQAVNALGVSVMDAVAAASSSSRKILAGGLATGGGDLTTDRTITVAKASQAETSSGLLDDKSVTPFSMAPALAGKASVAALGNDPNFAATMTAALAGKVATSAFPQTAFTAIGGSTPRSLDSWFAGLGKTDTPPKTGFWVGYDPSPPNIFRMRDRLFFGGASSHHGGRTDANTTPISSSAIGASWAFRDSQAIVFHDRGKMALTGYSRASDGLNLAGDALIGGACIGVSGFVINDYPGMACWGLYSDIQHESSTGASYGLEIAAKNKGNDSTASPYGLGNGVFGIWMQGGGDSTYGGASTNPNNSAIVILKGGNTWNRGIVFSADALTGSDGTTGASQAIVMARGHTIRWESAAGVAGARIRSDTTIGARDISQVFDNFSVYWIGNTGKKLLELNTSQSGGTITGVNFVQITSGATGTPAVMASLGDDANSSVALKGKGTGGAVLQDGAGAAKMAINTTGIGFFAATPVVKPTLAAAATDPATTQTLVNSIRTALINYGLAA